MCQSKRSAMEFSGPNAIDEAIDAGLWTLMELQSQKRCLISTRKLRIMRD